MTLLKFVSAGLLVGLSLSAAMAQIKVEMVAPAGAPDSNFQLPDRAIYTVRPANPGDLATLDAQSAAGTTIPLWNANVTSFGTNYSFEMVGKSPLVKQTGQTSKITSPVIPVIFKFETTAGVLLHTFSPIAADPVCSPAGTGYSLALASPLLNDHAYTVGGKNIGNTQYVDFFQRANFYEYTKPGSTNPKYHVLLTQSNSSTNPLTVTVTVKGFPIDSEPCGEVGLIEYNQWDSLLQGTIFPELAADGVTAKTFPIFEFYNVVMYNETESNCCILGYHGNFTNAGAFQTYAVSNFDTSGAFTGSFDISGMSHEIAEWMNDPTGTNPTPAWGHIGQVSGCQSNLEVGDPLSGTTVIVTMPNGYHYHPQELAFFSWFYRESPSIGLDGWYSSNDTFKTSAGPICE
jgi:hypothetical protein